MFALPAKLSRALNRFPVVQRLSAGAPGWGAPRAPQSGVNFALIIGAQRSGTTWLQMLCAAHPLIAGGEESHLFSHYLGNFANAFYTHKKQINSGGGAQGLPCYLTSAEFEAMMRQFASATFAKLLRHKPGARLVVEKTPDHALHIGLIRNLFPRTKIVHLIRDGRDVAVSQVAAGKEFWGEGWAPANVCEAAERWVRWVTRARAWANHPPELYHELRYEQLRGDGPAALAGVYDFLGMPLPIERVKALYDQFSLAACNDGTAPKVIIRCGEKPQRRPAAAATTPGAAPAAAPAPAGQGQNRPAPLKGFFRKGKAGGWRESLVGAELEAVEAITAPLLTELGYELSTPAKSNAPAA